MHLHDYSRLYVISDLHLGGLPGARIFTQSQALTKFVRDLTRTAEAASRAAPRPSPIGLVLNGDIVDFLADAPHGTYLDWFRAADRLTALMRDAEFAPIFGALAELLEQDSARLVLVLGNHDLELRLPDVQSALLTGLCRSDAARGRVRLALDGTGYRCRVAGRTVLCVHGNDVDPWNAVDHEALRRVVEARCFGRTPAPGDLTPNAGTRLVLDVMNEVKARRPFVDLLKPEDKAVVEVLQAMGESFQPLLRRVLPLIAGWVVGKARTGGLLALSPEVEVLQPDAGADLPATARPGTEALLELGSRQQQEFEERLGMGRRNDPVTEALELQDQVLFSPRLWWDGLWKEDLRTSLRAVLQERLRGDRSFEVGQLDQTGDEILRRTHCTDVIVAGHTHLARALQRDGRLYFNSGTWIDLLKLDESCLASDEAFAPLLAALESADRRALEPFVEHPCNVVELEAAGDGRLLAWLHRREKGSELAPDSLELTP